MSDNFSLNDLFKVGLDKDKFKTNFLQAKDNNALQDMFSIFGEDVEGSVDNIFAEVDKDGDGKISTDEFKNVKNSFQDTDQNNITTNDIKSLYMSSVMRQYGTSNPKQMYAAAMSGVQDVRSSNYVLDLNTQIETLDDMIQSRKTASELKIREYQNQIDEIVRNATSKKGIDTSEYNAQSSETKNLQNEYNSKNNELKQKELELNRAQNEQKILQKELKDLEKDAENNKTEIEGVKFDLDGITSRINTLSGDISALKSDISSVQEKLKASEKKQEQIQKNIISDDKEAQAKVKALKEKVKAEENSAQKDVERYQNESNQLNKARTYAIQELQNQTAVSSVTNLTDADYSNTGANCPSLSGVNYSAEKGQKLAEYMRAHAKGFTGYCSRHVSNGIAGVGLGTERAPSAHMMDSLLAKNSNFKEITVSSKEELKNLPAGCIIVYEAGAAGYNRKHGHIEVSLGNGTNASDGITRNPRYAPQGQMHVFVPVA